jgi:hypothetical protein
MTKGSKNNMAQKTKHYQVPIELHELGLSDFSYFGHVGIKHDGLKRNKENPVMSADILDREVKDLLDNGFTISEVYSPNDDFTNSIKWGFATLEKYDGLDPEFKKEQKGRYTLENSGALYDGTTVSELEKMSGMQLYKKADEIENVDFYNSISLYGMAAQLLEEEITTVDNNKQKMELLNALTRCYRKVLLYHNLPKDLKLIPSEGEEVALPFGAIHCTSKISSLESRIKSMSME